MKELQKNKVKINKGFTLVEILIVSGMIATIGTIIVIVLFATIRASKKSDTLISLKQSGSSIVSQVTKGVRYAKSIDPATVCDATTPLTQIKVTSVSDNAQTTYACIGGSTPTIASNGASLLDTKSATVSSCSFYCSKPSVNDLPVINLSFTLRTRSSGSADSSGSVPFRTSIIMRNVTN